MDQLIALYSELLRGANDEQIVTHVTNLVSDVAAMADAVKAVVDAARARNVQ